MYLFINLGILFFALCPVCRRSTLRKHSMITVGVSVCVCVCVCLHIQLHLPTATWGTDGVEQCWLDDQ